MKTTNRAFTLVELLVVVTIIVILLALLVPAMDRAIYQSELMLCGSKLKTIGTGVNLYAFDHKRLYPARTAIDQNFNVRPDYLVLKGLVANEAAVADMDERRSLAGYVVTNPAFNCPLSEEVDLEVDNSPEPTWIYTSYALWYGFKYVVKDQPERALRKVGDRVTWDGNRFSVLADDSDSIDTDSWVSSTHPDESGFLSSEVFRNELQTSGFYVTFSFMTMRGGGSTRGPIDRNFAYTDGSVRRITGLELDDDRMVAVPDRSSTTGWDDGLGRRRWLPKGE